VLLSFDLEEFDLPLEHGMEITLPEMLEVSTAGLTRLLDALDELGVPATFFTTVCFAEARPALMELIASRHHEPASHGVEHSRPGLLAESRQRLERVCGTQVLGYRPPWLKPFDRREAADAGYLYSSSINPAWVPGRYMNLFKRRLPHFEEGLLELPISAAPLIRFPLFWLSFRNMPLQAFKALTSITLNSGGYLNIYFHPWEFADWGRWKQKMPAYLRTPGAPGLLERFLLYVEWLKDKAWFLTCGDYARMYAGGAKNS
jgi:peptidoglycan/xylan/chitin deacetylase (PgdA/CDA1 family)